MVKCQKAKGSDRVCELGIKGCEVVHLVVPGLKFTEVIKGELQSTKNDFARRRTDGIPQPTSDAARLLTLESAAYDGGTRRNTINFLTFQVPDLLEAVRVLVKEEQAYRDARNARTSPLGATITEHRQLLEALDCRDMYSALAKIEALKARPLSPVK